MNLINIYGSAFSWLLYAVLSDFKLENHFIYEVEVHVSPITYVIFKIKKEKNKVMINNQKNYIISN